MQLDFICKLPYHVRRCVRVCKLFFVRSVCNFLDRVKRYLSKAGVILFADDTLLFLVVPSLDVLYKKIHNVVSEFLTFFHLNQLTLNFFKAFFIIFSRLSSSAGNDQITVRGNLMKRVAKTKYLGF